MHRVPRITQLVLVAGGIPVPTQGTGKTGPASAAPSPEAHLSGVSGTLTGRAVGGGGGGAEGNPLGPLRCDEQRGLRRSGQPEFSFFFGRACSPQQFPGQGSDQSHTRDHTKPLTTGTFSEWFSQALPPAWPWFPAPLKSLKSLSSALEQVNCPQRLGLKTHDSAKMLLGS